jgi:hypothetical protein
MELTKRKRAPFSSTSPSKRQRIGPGSNPRLPHPTSADRLSALPNEILVRILKQLPVETVLLCQSVSRRWRTLSRDGEVWRSLFWNRWVKGARRGKRSEIGDGGESKWVSEERRKQMLGAAGKATATTDTEMEERMDWKARYRLRHNWSRGAAEVKVLGLEVPSKTSRKVDHTVDDKTSSKGRFIVQLSDGRIITVDQTNGLRAWDLPKGSDSEGMECIAYTPISGSDGIAVPTCLCLDSAPVDDSKSTYAVSIVVGFSDGGFGLWKLEIGKDRKGKIEAGHRRQGTGEEDVALTNAAYHWPYLLTISEEQVLSLYSFAKPQIGDINTHEGSEAEYQGGNQEPKLSDSKAEQQAPRHLASLKSHTSWPPLSLSIRETPQATVASVAYALPTHTAGWSVGLQELHISKEGKIILSRLASAVSSGFQPLGDRLSPPSSPSSCSHSKGAERQSNDCPHCKSKETEFSRVITPKPTSLSYSHPYLLASHADNTLTLFMVTSNREILKIGPGKTLWGHTEGVKDAVIGGRGKAVSLAERGGDIRVWELEAGKRSHESQHGGIKVREARASAVDGQERFLRDVNKHQVLEGAPEHTGSWIGFDEEIVLVFREREKGDGRLVVYDFT